MPSPRAIFYINLMTDPNPHVRKKAVQAIGQIGDQTSLFRLQEAVAREQDADVREAIRGEVFSRFFL